MIYFLSILPGLAAAALGLRAMNMPFWTYIFLLGALLVGSLELSGHSKPYYAEWRSMTDLEVVGMYYVPGVAIYAWVNRGGEPIAYRLPWNDQQAKKAQMSTAQGRPLVLSVYPDMEPVVRERPQEANPIKR